MPDGAPSPKTPDLLEALAALRAAFPVSALSAGLPLVCSMMVLPWLELQRTLLTAYQETLTKVSAPPERAASSTLTGQTGQTETSGQPDDEARRRMIRLMQAYLDSGRSAPDYGTQLLAWHSDLVRGYLQIVEGALRSFERNIGG